MSNIRAYIEVISIRDLLIYILIGFPCLRIAENSDLWDFRLRHSAQLLMTRGSSYKLNSEPELISFIATVDIYCLGVYEKGKLAIYLNMAWTWTQKW